MSFNFTQARGHVPSSFLTLGHWAEKEENSKRRRRNKGLQLIIPQNRTPALEETTNPGIGERAAQGAVLATVFVLDTLSLVPSLAFVTISSMA